VAVDRGQRVFQVLEALRRLGAEIARGTGEFAVHRHAELAGNVDGAARARALDHMGVAAAAAWSKDFEAMNGHGCDLLSGWGELPLSPYMQSSARPWQRSATMQKSCHYARLIAFLAVAVSLPGAAQAAALDGATLSWPWNCRSSAFC